MSILVLAFLLAAAPESPPSSVEGMQPAPGVPSLLQSGVPAMPADLRSRTGQYLNARAASLADVSDDGGTLLITTRFASTAVTTSSTRPSLIRMRWPTWTSRGSGVNEVETIEALPERGSVVMMNVAPVCS